MTKGKTKICFSNNNNILSNIRGLLAKKTDRTDFWVVWVYGNNVRPDDPSFCFPTRANPSKVLLVFEGLPVDPEILGIWREWALGKGSFNMKVVFYNKSSASSVADYLKKNLGGWMLKSPDREQCAVRREEWVKLPAGKAQKGESSLLTLQFGKMGELLSRLDWVKHRFTQAVSIQPTYESKYLEEISKRLKRPRPDEFRNEPELSIEERLDLLPRILLLGETGVGKTLFARYLAGGGKFDRISIPEYLEKEDMFEYAMFGYAAHAFNNADSSGSKGLLLNNIGGVVFLDEIGEASPKIQAKLLAFLDDYIVRPRGWEGKGFYCPVLIVGATNKKDIVKGEHEYRNDLIQRFTDIQTIPPLKERKENMPLFIDCLLENEGINNGGVVKEVGKKAYDSLFNRDYQDGNFREMENLIRAACRRARMDGRDYLVEEDLTCEES